jgi:hypothetical protein
MASRKPTAQTTQPLTTYLDRESTRALDMTEQEFAVAERQHKRHGGSAPIHSTRRGKPSNERKQ